jgi:hypothetical protein
MITLVTDVPDFGSQEVISHRPFALAVMLLRDMLPYIAMVLLLGDLSGFQGTIGGTTAKESRWCRLRVTDA